VATADVILHVRDIAHPDSGAQRADVEAVLETMVKEGTLDADWQRRTIEVLNKVDLIGGAGDIEARSGAVAVSALTGEGLPALLQTIDTRLSEGTVTVGYDIPASDGAELAWLYRHGEVVGRHDNDNAIHVTVRLAPEDHARFERQVRRLARENRPPARGGAARG
jgi:GTP-binding protein HflX